MSRPSDAAVSFPLKASFSWYRKVLREAVRRPKKVDVSRMGAKMRLWRTFMSSPGADLASAVSENAANATPDAAEGRPRVAAAEQERNPVSGQTTIRPDQRSLF